MPNYKVTAATVASLLASTSLATAGVVHSGLSYTESHSFASTPAWGTNGVAKTSFAPTHALNFVGYNPNHTAHTGHLTGVQIQVFGTATGKVTVTRTGGTVGKISVTNLETLRVKLPTPGLSSTNASVKLNPNKSVSTTLAPGGKATLSVSATTKTGKLGATSLTPFESAWIADAGDYGSIALTAGFKGTAHFGGTAGTKVVTTYKYAYTTTPTTPVPEPGSFALIGAGLIGLGVMRRRRAR